MQEPRSTVLAQAAPAKATVEGLEQQQSIFSDPEASGMSEVRMPVWWGSNREPSWLLKLSSVCLLCGHEAEEERKLILVSGVSEKALIPL